MRFLRRCALSWPSVWAWFAVVLLGFAVHASTPEGWIALHGGLGMQEATAICGLRNGGCIVAGETDWTDRGSSDMWVLKLSTDGEIVWEFASGWASNSYTGTGLEGAHTVAELANGDVVVAGWTTQTQFAAPASWVHRYTQDGILLWQKAYGGDLSLRCAASEVCELSDGTIALVGSSFSGLSSASDLWAACLTGAGELVWQRSFGGSDVDGATSVASCSDGGFLVVGETSSFGAGDTDAWLLKLDSTGEAEWQFAYGSQFSDTAYAALETRDGGFVIAGWIEASALGDQDLWVFRIDADGALVWEVSSGGNGDDKAYAIAPLGETLFAVAGESTSFGDLGRDAWLLAISDSGDIAWQRTYGWDNVQYAYDIDVVDAAVYVAGTWTLGLFDTDALVMSLQSDGLLAWDCDAIQSSAAQTIDLASTVTKTNAAPRATSASVRSTSVIPVDPGSTSRFECTPERAVLTASCDKYAWNATGVANDFAYSPDGHLLASSADAVVELRDSGTAEILHVLEGHDGNVGSLAFSPDGGILATASKRILLWDTGTGQLVSSLEGHEGWVKGLAFSPDGKTLASASADGTVQLWDLTTEARSHTLVGHRWYVESVAFHPSDVAALASSSLDGTVRLWDAESGDLQATLAGHLGWVRDVTFSPDGLLLASASADRTVRLWDAKTGAYVTSLEGPADEVYCVSFSPDARLIAGGCEDGAIYVWDVSTGELVVRLMGHKGSVAGVAFSPDGSVLASISGGAAAILWDTSQWSCR